MDKVYIIEGSEFDFFSSVVFCNDVTDDWEDFLRDVTRQASSRSSNDYHLTKFAEFMSEHGYMDQIADIIYDAEKVFVNEQIDATGAKFDYC